MKINKQIIGLLAGPLAFALILNMMEAEGLSEQGTAVLASTAWIAIWWITEAIAIEVTSLLPLILFPLLGVTTISETGAAYGHKFIFLFIGGFLLAIAIEKWQLHRRIALHIINLVGTSLGNIMLGFMLSTALLSMWISNTATTIMMLPIGVAVIAQIHQTIASEKAAQFKTALMLAIAYSASIGGMATLVGTPPNLVFAGIVEELFKVEISFMQWFTFGFPVSMLLLFVCWYYLSHGAFKLRGLNFPRGRTIIKEQLTALGGMTKQEKRVLTLFLLTAFAWISRSFILKDFIPNIDDTIIALIGATLLFIVPAGNGKGQLMEWKDAVKLPWGVLLLFGGGIALAVGFQGSGLAKWIGQQLMALQGVHVLLLVLIIVATVNFLTEITSNLATTSILLPILASLAVVIGVHPFLLLVGAAVAASCAFMLPVATAPNALVFGSGHIKIWEMIKTGIWLNIISIFILTILVFFLLPYFWGFEIMEGL